MVETQHYTMSKMQESASVMWSRDDLLEMQKVRGVGGEHLLYQDVDSYTFYYFSVATDGDFRGLKRSWAKKTDIDVFTAHVEEGERWPSKEASIATMRDAHQHCLDAALEEIRREMS